MFHCCWWTNWWALVPCFFCFKFSYRSCHVEGKGVLKLGLCSLKQSSALHAVANSVCNFGNWVVVLARLKITLNPPSVFEHTYTKDSTEEAICKGGKNSVGLESQNAPALHILYMGGNGITFKGYFCAGLHSEHERSKQTLMLPIYRVKSRLWCACDIHLLDATKRK